MKCPARKTTIFLLSGILALFLGGGIYILFRPNTYIFEIFAKSPWLLSVRRVFWFLNCEWIKYYLVDYIWAFSLCCGLHLLFNPKTKGSFICTGIVAVYGTFFEILQFRNIIHGTGDLWDILMFILAGFTVNMINLIPNKERKK